MQTVCIGPRVWTPSPITTWAIDSEAAAADPCRHVFTTPLPRSFFTKLKPLGPVLSQYATGVLSSNGIEHLGTVIHCKLAMKQLAVHFRCFDQRIVYAGTKLVGNE